MDDQEKDRLVIRSFPVRQWLVGATFMVAGFYAVFAGLARIWYVLAGIGLATILGSGGGSTIVARRRPPKITLTRRSLFRPESPRIFGVGEVVSVDVEGRRISESRSHYRLTLTTSTGDVFAFTTFFSSELAKPERQAERLRAFLWMPASTTGAPTQGTGDASDPRTIEPSTDLATMSGSTDGIPWLVESGPAPGCSTLFTRWSSAAVTVPDGCLMLIQTASRPRDPIRIGSGLGIALLRQFPRRLLRICSDLGIALLRQLPRRLLRIARARIPGLVEALSGNISTPMLMVKAFTKMLGVDPVAISSLNRAESIEGLEARLEGRYHVLGTDPAVAERVLNGKVAPKLVAWAQRHPIRSVQLVTEAHPGPTTVLFTPSGMMIGFIVAIQDPAMIAEISRLGVDLALANRPERDISTDWV